MLMVAAGGGFMRVRAEIAVQEPIVRYVTVTSLKLKRTETFSVMYERLPFYCFSCGLLGHSSVMCPTPGTRNENGDLPYAAKKLCVNDEHPRRSGGSRSSTASSSAAGAGSFGDARSAAPCRGKSREQVGADAVDGEVSSPIKRGGAARGRGRSTRGRGRGRITDPGRELFPAPQKRTGAAGQKRKSGKVPASTSLQGQGENNALALVPVTGRPVGCLDEVQNTDVESNKKQRLSNNRSADPAEAAVQSRQTQ